MAPSDYFLFRNLKSYLRGVHYPDDEVVKEDVKEWLEGQTEDFYYFLVELTVCEKNVANALNSVVIILKNKVQFIVKLQNFLNAPRKFVLFGAQ